MKFGLLSAELHLRLFFVRVNGPMILVEDPKGLFVAQ